MAAAKQVRCSQSYCFTVYTPVFAVTDAVVVVAAADEDEDDEDDIDADAATVVETAAEEAAGVMTLVVVSAEVAAGTAADLAAVGAVAVAGAAAVAVAVAVVAGAAAGASAGPLSFNSCSSSAMNVLGLVEGPWRATARPMRLIRNFVKFHFTKEPRVPRVFAFTNRKTGWTEPPFTLHFSNRSNFTSNSEVTYFLISALVPGSWLPN